LSGIELKGNKWLRDQLYHQSGGTLVHAAAQSEQTAGRLAVAAPKPKRAANQRRIKTGDGTRSEFTRSSVTDQQPFRFGLQIDNQRPPSVGQYEIWALASDLNLTRPQV
jgi:hypothetical protein